MSKKVLLALALGLALTGPTGAVVTADAAQYRGGNRVDRMIERAFSDALGRSPDDREYRRYRLRVEEDHWSERDISDDLRGRRDYRPHGERTERERGSYDTERVVRNAYRDILGRDPDSQGLRDYRRKMENEGWTERQLREALRDSNEHRTNPAAAADRIVRRAYQDVLGRDPDASGLASYRNEVAYHGWDEHDVREALMKSPEYRQKNTLTPDRAREIVRRAYLSVLGREPDPASATYVDKVLRDHWSERDVARELRNSDEYRNRQ